MRFPRPSLRILNQQELAISAIPAVSKFSVSTFQSKDEPLEMPLSPFTRRLPGSTALKT